MGYIVHGFAKSQTRVSDFTSLYFLELNSLKLKKVPLHVSNLFLPN